MTPDDDLVRALQERAARATATTAQEHREGVWLRHSDDPLTWWANAAIAHRTDPATAVGVAEAFYARRRAPARFQVCPACPPGLDAVLAERGYERSGSVSLQTASALVVASIGTDVDVRIKAGRAPMARAAAVADGREVAVGRAVADDGWVGVFAMATLPDARRQGAACAVLAALASWAVGQGCPQLYLQVTRDSEAALGLYRRAGFVPIADYHYRTRPV